MNNIYLCQLLMLYVYNIRLLASDQKHATTQISTIPIIPANTEEAEDVHLPNILELNAATLQLAIQTSI